MTTNTAPNHLMQLLDMLVCPLCKGKLIHHHAEHGARWLVCRADKLAYPIVDDVPNMLIEQAHVLDDAALALVAKHSPLVATVS
jgi:uncharacterized protein YbaR (Trm112 family)